MAEEIKIAVCVGGVERGEVVEKVVFRKCREFVNLEQITRVFDKTQMINTKCNGASVFVFGLQILYCLLCQCCHIGLELAKLNKYVFNALTTES